MKLLGAGDLGDEYSGWDNNHPPLDLGGGWPDAVGQDWGGVGGFVAGMCLLEPLGGEIGRRRAANFADFTRRSRLWGGLGERIPPKNKWRGDGQALSDG